MTPLYQRSATELIADLKSRRHSVREVAQAHLKRIAALEPQVHAWAFQDPERVLREADKIDQTPPDPSKLLAGLPVGVKDIYNTADFPTEMGSRIWKGFLPGNDARVVFNLRYEAGLVIGKTVTSEFAVHEATETRNPWNLEHAPGTSSTGSAAAVACGMVPFALGSQTGGSTIRPASYCGVVGFKPSFGLVPRTGVLKTTDTLDTVGWFTRTVEDAELFFEILRVKGLNYPYVNENVVRRPLAEPIRVGLYRGPFWNAAEPYARAALEQATQTLAKSGAFQLSDRELPEAQDIWEAHELIYCRALSYYFRSEERNTRDKISAVLLDMLVRGEKIDPAAYHALTQKQAERTIQMQQDMKDDVWITLSAGGEAPRGLQSADRPDSCKIWTYLGMPAISLPLFQGPNRLPVGLQIVAPKYADYKLLDSARQIWTALKGEVRIADPKQESAVA